MGFQRPLLFTEGGVVVSSVEREADTRKLRITGRDIIAEKGNIEIWRNTEETRQNAILAHLLPFAGFFSGYQKCTTSTIPFCF